MSNLKHTIAIIAEDNTDCDTFRNIVHRVLGKQIKVKHWGANGCSTLKQKLPAKLKAMHDVGCDAFIIVHDLDRNPENNSLNDEERLRQILEDASSNVKYISKYICIPIEELEAWFLSDPNVVQYIGRGKGSAHPNPHLVSKPKEYLIKLSIDEKRKPRYATNMNAELIDRLDFDICAQRCGAFKNLLDFLNSL